MGILIGMEVLPIWWQALIPKARKSERESLSVMSDTLRPDGLHSHGILQARILHWVAFPFSKGSSQPRDLTQFSHIASRFFTSCATRGESDGKKISPVEMAEELQVRCSPVADVQLFIIPQEASSFSFFPDTQESLLCTMAFSLVVYFGRNEDQGGCT